MSLPEETFIILLRGDVDFTPSQRYVIDEAIDEWYEFTNGKFLFHIIYDLHKLDLDAPMTDDLIFKVDFDFHHIRQNDARNKVETFGLCFNRSTHSIMYIAADRLCTQMLFKTTIMHELGHYLGLQHIEQRDSIMYAYVNKQIKFSEHDAVEFCDRYGCDLSELVY